MYRERQKKRWREGVWREKERKKERVRERYLPIEGQKESWRESVCGV